MSANNEVVIRRKQNGLYEIRELQTEDGTIGENTLSIIGDDIDGQKLHILSNGVMLVIWTINNE